jgi:hypothetical protein
MPRAASNHQKYFQFYYMFARSDIYFRLHLLPIIIHITRISLSLRRTTSCIVIAGLLERDTFDLFLPGFDKPWMIHLRETCCCSTNLCTWRSYTVYKNRSVRRHQSPARTRTLTKTRGAPIASRPPKDRKK